METERVDSDREIVPPVEVFRKLTMASAESFVLAKYTPNRTFIGVFHCHMKQCLKAHGDDDTSVATALITTGNAKRAYMTRLREYMAERWPDLEESPERPRRPGREAQALLIALSETLLSGHCHSKVKRGLRFLLKLEEGSQGAERLGVAISSMDVRDIVMIVQVLSLLALAFRPWDTQGVFSSSGQIRPTSQGVKVILDELIEIPREPSNSCCIQFLRGAIVVSHFPVKTAEEGLEIPLSVMLHVAEICHRNEPLLLRPGGSREHGIYYGGATTLLYPVRMAYTGDHGPILHWHFEESDSGGIGPPADDTWLRIDSQATLENAITVVGD